MANDPDLGPAAELSAKPGWLSSTGAVLPSASDLTSLNLSFLIYKVGTLTPSLRVMRTLN